jgi:two-component system sensor histidine kinase PilS (NtrC family)
MTKQPGERMQPQTFDRFWSTFTKARLAVASALMALQLFAMVWGSSGHWFSAVICGLYVLSVLRDWMAPTPSTEAGSRAWPWTLSVGVDLVVFALLQLLQHGAFNYTLLFALPVLMAAILGTRSMALGAAAVATLFLLGDVAWALLSTGDDSAPRFVQSAITGAGLFLVALLAHQLALRLAREEVLSHSSQLAARTQARVNELVIASMHDGVAVVDARGQVRTANPAARHMLGDASGPMPTDFVLSDSIHCAALSELVAATFVQRLPQQAEVLLEPASDLRRRLRARSQLTHANADNPISTDESLCVLFLEDMHELEARVRTENLAAMGRMTVAVAHEIRNPLSAIVQANELLQEDLASPLQQQLSRMIATHTHRLNRIVDDVLNVARVPGQLAAPGSVDAVVLDTVVAHILSEWCSQNACNRRLLWQAQCAQQAVRFDTEHLRRVLVNLLDNARRYASDAVGAIQVGTRPDRPGILRLSVWSDGVALEPSVKRHLFEPFFSSESRSSGLGLYLCRELCERYSTSLNYARSERDGKKGNEFFLLIPMDRPESAT